MDEEFLAELRNEIIFRVHTVLSDRYGESVPESLWNSEAKKEEVFETIRRLESFKSDKTLIDLLEVLRKTFTGDYGRCLFCGEQVDLPRLLENPLTKFCKKCESHLTTTPLPRRPYAELLQDKQAITTAGR